MHPFICICTHIHWNHQRSSVGQEGFNPDLNLIWSLSANSQTQLPAHCLIRFSDHTSGDPSFFHDKNILFKLRPGLHCNWYHFSLMLSFSGVCQKGCRLLPQCDNATGKDQPTIGSADEGFFNPWRSVNASSLLVAMPQSTLIYHSFYPSLLHLQDEL